MRLHPCEPFFGDGEVTALTAVVDRLRKLPRRRSSGPFILAIDGRSSNGKSTLAGRLADVVPGAEVVHTDDVAWWHSAFAWDHLLLTWILQPLERGEDVAYRPPGWDNRGREGAITVSARAPIVIVEGVGSARRSLRPHLDAVIWVQSDLDVADARDVVRVAAGENDQAGYDQWMAEEIPFQEAERTWERADIVLSGTPSLDHDPTTAVVLMSSRV